MKPVLLIAANLLRQQRWYAVLLVLMAWLFGAGAGLGLASGGPVTEDALFYLRQQAVYATALSVIVAASALHNERRSRRILAVLAKAVERSQYLAGLLAGALGLALLYCLATGVMATWIAARLHWPASDVWVFVALVFAACALLAAWATLLSTFLHPFFATVATGLVVGAQLALERVLGAGASSYLPVSGLVRGLVEFHGDAVWNPPVAAAFLALAETALLWAVGSRIFARRDITVAIE